VNSQCALDPQAKQNEKKRASHSVQPTASPLQRLPIDPQQW